MGQWSNSLVELVYFFFHFGSPWGSVSCFQFHYFIDDLVVHWPVTITLTVSGYKNCYWFWINCLLIWFIDLNGTGLKLVISSVTADLLIIFMWTVQDFSKSSWRIRSDLSTKTIASPNNQRWPHANMNSFRYVSHHSKIIVYLWIKWKAYCSSIFWFISSCLSLCRTVTSACLFKFLRTDCHDTYSFSLVSS